MNISDIQLKTNKGLKIAYLSVNDPLDKRSWSGLTYYIGRTLQRNIGDVDFLGPIKHPWLLDKTLRAIAKFTRVVFRREYITKYSIIYGWYAARILKRKMKNAEYDFICAPAASTELCFLKTDIPIIYVTDTTFKLISRYYKKDFKNMSWISKWEGNFVEKKSLNKSSIIIYPSSWAEDSAVNDYHINRDKIALFPYGANMDKIPGREVILEKEKNTTLTLLYLAVEWERKGGPIAFETLKHLCEKNIDTKLIVCGCVPPANFVHPNLTIIPFLNKNKPDEHAAFLDLLINAHFLILPTRADCSLIVASEANAYGMPVITTETGGVPYVVRDCVNGYCLPYNADAEMYATLLSELFFDKEKYHELILTSRKRFEEELNWDKWAENLLRLYQTKIVKTKELKKHSHEGKIAAS